MVESETESLRIAGPILSLIRDTESADDYDAYFSGSVISPPKPISQMTLREVLSWQRRSVKRGSFSSASGAYQFIRTTLLSTAREMKLDLDTVWTSELQDRMALQLLRRRGFEAFRRGQKTVDEFAMDLSQEWAGLPRPDTGRSYYRRDGVNVARTTTSRVREALVQVLERDMADEPDPEPDTEPALNVNAGQQFDPREKPKEPPSSPGKKAGKGAAGVGAAAAVAAVVSVDHSWTTAAVAAVLALAVGFVIYLSTRG